MRKPIQAATVAIMLIPVAAGDYLTALIELRPLAEVGNAEAQALLGSRWPA